LFSRLDDAIDLIPVKGAHPNKVASLLSRASKEELEHRGVPAFLAAQGNTPVTREALRTHLQAHPAPFPKVKRSGDQRLTELPEGYSIRPLTDDERSMARAPFALIGPTPAHDRFLPQTRNANEALEDALSFLSSERNLGAKYAQYQVPGGTNYRETVLTLPNERLRDAVAVAKRGDQYQYQSPHFDEPNVLVHTRSNERTLPTGERGRFLEEVQSDWHQAGKQEGYRQAGDEFGLSPWKYLRERGYEDRTLTRGQAERKARDIGWVGGEDAVPDAPFKDSWQDLGFKQQLLEVADDPTLDWIGWTSGKAQAARYDLSKQIGQVTAKPTSDGLVHLEALTPGMDEVIVNEVVSLYKLDGIIGKEIAEKIRAGIRFPASPRHYARGDRGVPVELTGLDLQVGGEGMVEFYDRLLPKRVAKIVKPFGGIVEQVSLGGKAALYRSGQPDQWIVRLTPEMKAKIKQGLPLLALPAGVQVSASRPEED
jgi:hypothetical protein